MPPPRESTNRPDRVKLRNRKLSDVRQYRPSRYARQVSYCCYPAGGQEEFEEFTACILACAGRTARLPASEMASLSVLCREFFPSCWAGKRAPRMQRTDRKF